eukprot:scaffold7626_cov159-Amphora_coffeaeformis.AAC.4
MHYRLPKKLLILVLAWWTVAAALPRAQWGVAASSSSSSSSSSATSDGSCTDDEKDPENVLRQFIQQHKPDCRINFKIQGWRWHTMSLIREASRLASALSSWSSSSSSSSEQQATTAKVDFQTVADYVVQFNMRGLHRIQDDLFFPWVRQEIQTRCLDPAVAAAFSAVMTQLERQQTELERLGKQLVSGLYVFVRVRTPLRACAHVRLKLHYCLNHSNRNTGIYQTQLSRNTIDQASRTTATLAATAQGMLKTEDALLVPIVAHFVPVREQVSFNNKVIRSLGVWDSRLHLVGMHEAVVHYKNNDGDAHAADVEYASFENEIPYLPRMMIPRWKRNLYDPKVAILVKHEEEVLSHKN